MKEEKRKWLEVDKPYVVTLNTTPELCGLGFECIVCHQPAAFLICSTSDDPRLGGFEYENPKLMALMGELRDRLGTNFEFPTCAEHADGGATQ